MAYLAIDYGEKRIGLAIADEETKIPLPLGAILNKGNLRFLKEIQTLVERNKINCVLVGWPLLTDGTEGKRTAATQKFIDNLAEILKLPIIKIDERFSSRLSQTLSGRKKAEKDMGAAMVILEDFLSRAKLAEAN
ncbi:MAG: Holliday junction resolvase RuvX [Candidatus Magasanikbacteria bacterium]|nr:Holliday junction resolvase RuvX [Candidatus Magasanikbacteria bacterium]